MLRAAGLEPQRTELFSHPMSMWLSVFQFLAAPLLWPRSTGAVRRFLHSGFPRAPSRLDQPGPRDSEPRVGPRHDVWVRRRLPYRVVVLMWIRQRRDEASVRLRSYVTVPSIRPTG